MRLQKYSTLLSILLYTKNGKIVWLNENKIIPSGNSSLDQKTKI